MSSFLLTSLIVLAVLIVVVLAIIAYRLQSKVNAMEREKQLEQQAIEKQQAEHVQYLSNSIRILSQGIVDEQVSMTEGAIRITVLLDNLDVSEGFKQDYQVFYQLAEATAHIPILDAWKKLSAKERFAFDKERIAAEAKFGDFIIDAAKRLREQTFAVEK